MKSIVFIAFLVLLSGCSSYNYTSKGASVFSNFCGNAEYAILQDKGVMLNGLMSEPGLVIAVKNRLTGSMVSLSPNGGTYTYLPSQEAQDNYFIFIDKNALENITGYCDYSVAINQRTGEFLILNTTRLVTFS